IHRSLEGGAGLLGALLLAPFPGAPGRDDHDDEHRGRHDIVPPAVPQLLEPFPADFLVDLVEDVGQKTSPARNALGGRSPVAPHGHPGGKSAVWPSYGRDTPSLSTA